MRERGGKGEGGEGGREGIEGECNRNVCTLTQHQLQHYYIILCMCEGYLQTKT